MTDHHSYQLINQNYNNRLLPSLIDQSIIPNTGRRCTSCTKCHEDKKKCLPVFNSSETCAGFHRCLKKDVVFTFAYPNSEHAPFSTKQPPNKSSFHTGLSSSSTSIPAKKRIVEMFIENGEADKSGHTTLLPPFSIYTPTMISSMMMKLKIWKQRGVDLYSFASRFLFSSGNVRELR